jgi:hypothetical protein
MDKDIYGLRAARKSQRSLASDLGRFERRYLTSEPLSDKARNRFANLAAELADDLNVKGAGAQNGVAQKIIKNISRICACG